MSTPPATGTPHGSTRIGTHIARPEQMSRFPADVPAAAVRLRAAGVELLGPTCDEPGHSRLHLRAPDGHAREIAPRERAMTGRPSTAAPVAHGSRLRARGEPPRGCAWLIDRGGFRGHESHDG